MVKWTVQLNPLTGFLMITNNAGGRILLLPAEPGHPVTPELAQAMVDGLNAEEERKVLLSTNEGTA